MAEQSEKDRDIRGSNIVNQDDLAAYQKGLRELIDANKLPDAPSPHPVDAARQALHKARNRRDSSQDHTPPEAPVQYRIAKHYRDTAKQHLPIVRDQLHQTLTPEDTDPTSSDK